MTTSEVSVTDLKNAIKQTDVKSVSGLFQIYHDRVLIEGSVTDIDALLVTVFLIDKIEGKSGSDRKNTENLFVSLGRKRNHFRVMISLAKKRGYIQEERDVLYLLSDGLKRLSQVLGQIEKTPVRIVSSGEKFTAIKLLEEFLVKEVNGTDLLVCDSHVSAETLFPLSVLKGKIKILRILTSEVHDQDKLNSYIKKFEKETGIKVEVKQSYKIHDRYLFFGTKCWSIGTSIKDLGNKDTTLKDMSEVAKDLYELIEQRWKEAKEVG